jgi:hypothetical protein
MATTILGQQFLKFPDGNTAARPTGATGLTRFNTTTSTLEYYNGTSWIGIGLLDGSSAETAAPSAAYIKTLTGAGSGTYWIKNSAMTTAVQVYCDMTYDGGGYMLLAWGNTGGYNIPNLNHNSTQYSYAVNSRSSSNGLIASTGGQQSALLIAKSCSNMIMAAGNDPATGGIDSYGYVYKFAIPSPSSLTFQNHNVNHSSGLGVSTVTVTALKGDSGSYTRYTTTESLGATWNDSYPTGYGCITNTNPRNNTFDAGPFFPSIHPRNGGYTSQPDVGVNGFSSGNLTYTFRGWYSANGNGFTGQTSMWVK